MGRFMDLFNARASQRLKTKKDLNSRKKAERTKLKQAMQMAKIRARNMQLGKA